MLRNVTPKRQQEIVDMMQQSADYTFCFVQLLVAATKRREFISVKTPTRGVTPDELTAIERIFGELEDAFQRSTPFYRDSAFTFLVSVAYGRRLLRNERITKYLKTFYPREYHDLSAMAAKYSPVRARGSASTTAMTI